MQVNKILEQLIKLTELAVKGEGKVALFYLPTPSFTGYIIALAKIEATNKSNIFNVTGTLFKAVEVGTKASSLFVPLNLAVELKNEEYNTTSSIAYERTLNIVDGAVNTRGFMAGVDFRASVELADCEADNTVIKEVDFKAEESQPPYLDALEAANWDYIYNKKEGKEPC